MRGSFEEVVADELDALYQGALFLSAGDLEAASELLLDAVGRAQGSFDRVHHRQTTRTRLYRILAQQFLERPPRYRLEQSDADDLAELQGSRDQAGEGAMDPAALTVYHAAGSTPQAARPALWLVLVRRWNYRDAAQALGIGLRELHELLRYRTTFIAAVVGDEDRLPGDTAIG